MVSFRPFFIFRDDGLVPGTGITNVELTAPHLYDCEGLALHSELADQVQLGSGPCDCHTVHSFCLGIVGNTSDV